MKNLKKTIWYITGLIKINVINEIKNGLEQIETEKNNNQIIKKNNDEILDLVEKEVEEWEDDDVKNIDEISKEISPKSILYEKIDEMLFNLSEIKENFIIIILKMRLKNKMKCL